MCRGESLFMLMMYGVYCIALGFNASLERWAQTWPVPCHKPVDEDQHLVSYKHLDDNQQHMANYSGTNVSPGDKALDFRSTGGQQQPPLQNPPGPPPRPEYYKAKDPNPNQVIIIK